MESLTDLHNPLFAGFPADAYQQWNQALDRAIVDLRESAKWATDKPWSMKYADFSASEEKMHGVSMFVPPGSLSRQLCSLQ